MLISKEEVIANEERLLESVKNNNLEQLDDLLHDDLLFHLPNGDIITKAMDLDAYKTGNMYIESIAASNYAINIISDTAVVSVLVQIKGKAFDQPLEGKLRYLRVWRIFNNRLKVIAGSCTKLA